MSKQEEVKTVVFQDFVQKARKRLEEKRVRKYRTLYIPSLDDNIKIRNLDYPEIVECLEMESEKDPNISDQYAIYLGVVEPDLKETAAQLKETGEIKTYLEIVNIFDMTEITAIAKEIMELSGALGGKKVYVVEELKNS